jgi:hypothetical protein
MEGEREERAFQKREEKSFVTTAIEWNRGISVRTTKITKIRTTRSLTCWAEMSDGLLVEKVSSTGWMDGRHTTHSHHSTLRLDSPATPRYYGRLGIISQTLLCMSRRNTWTCCLLYHHHGSRVSSFQVFFVTTADTTDSLIQVTRRARQNFLVNSMPIQVQAS